MTDVLAAGQTGYLPGSEAEKGYAYLAIIARAKKALAEGREVRVSPKEIRRYPNQPRKFFKQDSIRRLAESIQGIGQTTPGIIHETPGGDTQYELVDGERRWRATTLLMGTPFFETDITYRATLIEADEEAIRFLVAGIANFNRESHTATEISDSIEEYRRLDIPISEIAKLLGLSEHWTYQIHGLQKLDSRVRAMLDPELPRSQQLPVTAAVELSKIDPSLQFGLAQRVLKKDLRLGNLRKEVVHTARKAGVEVRVRERSPLDKWEAAVNRSNFIATSSSDLAELLRDKDLARIMGVHQTDVRKMRRDLQNAQESLARSIRALQQK